MSATVRAIVQAGDDRSEPGGDPGAPGPDIGSLLLEMPQEGTEGGPPLVWQVSGQHLEKHHPEGVEIAPGVNLLAQRLLWGKVLERPEERTVPSEARVVPVELARSLNNIARAYALPELRSIFLTSFFFNAGFGFFISFFGLFLISRFNFNEARIGNFFAWVGLCAIFTQIVTTRRVAAKFNERQVLRISRMLGFGWSLSASL